MIQRFLQHADTYTLLLFTCISKPWELTWYLSYADADSARIRVGGTLIAVGAPVSHSWVDLITTAYAGDSTLVVEGILSWRVRDEIVITPTDLDPHEVWYYTCMYVVLYYTLWNTMSRHIQYICLTQCRLAAKCTCLLGVVCAFLQGVNIHAILVRNAAQKEAVINTCTIFSWCHEAEIE